MGRLLVVSLLWLQIPHAIADDRPVAAAAVPAPGREHQPAAGGAGGADEQQRPLLQRRRGDSGRLVATVQTGLLGEGFAQIGLARKVSRAGRRLAVSKPQTIFAVEDCASMAGLSSAKKSALASRSITKCINVYGALVAGNSGVAACGAENNMIFLANTIAELLDTNLQGTPTDANVAKLVQNFDDDTARDFMLAGCTTEEEDFETSGTAWEDKGTSFSSQGWKTNPPDGKPEDGPAILTEEAFHFVHSAAWTKAYPPLQPFAATWTSNLGLCVQSAQCVWYMHDENSGCSDASGATCKSGSGATAACDGACASFKTPGQCYEFPDGHTCATPTCDIIEFFHKMYLGWLEDPNMKGNFYDLMVSSGAKTKAGITAKMQSTAPCTQLLQDMQNSAYALPLLPLTGVYTTIMKATTTALPPSGVFSFAFGLTGNLLVFVGTFLHTAWRALQ